MSTEKSMKTIFIICCNDSLECASFDKQKAWDKMEELAKEHYKKNKHNFSNIWENYEEYRKCVFWHLHQIELI